MKKSLYALSVTFLIASVITFIACNKNAGKVSTSNQNTNNIPPDVTVTASLQGRVLDENGVPVQGAAVTSGTATATTDINGVFSFTGISMSSRFGFVKVNKTGYFTGSRSIITNPGASNYVSIQLVPRAAKGTFPAGSGGSIAVAAGDTAAFSASSVVTASTNAAYTGTVHVYATYLDPTDSTLYKYMPGDLRGIGADGKETALQSFGMLQVELEGDGGEKLQLASGQNATLTWAIPTSLQATAPATVPLWYFNDTTGRWIQQGSATRQGNSYVGQVAHFTYWNCDVATGSVNFKVYLKDQLGNPLSYAYVQFQSQTWGTRAGYTDATGFTQGVIPKGQTLVMQVVTECGYLLAAMNVGPALTDQDLGTITVNLPNTSLVFKGSAVDCYNNPVDSGYVNVFLDGLNYRAVITKGDFMLPIMRCSSAPAQAKLTVADLNASQGTTATFTVTTDTVDVGQLSACSNPVTQYINLTYNGQAFKWAAPSSSLDFYNGTTYAQAGHTIITGYNGTNIDIYLPDVSSQGSYDISALEINAPGAYISASGGQCTVTSFASGTMTGTFNGNAYDSTLKTNVPISGTFNVNLRPD